MGDELHLDEKMKKVNQDMRNLLRGKNKHMNKRLILTEVSVFFKESML